MRHFKELTYSSIDNSILDDVYECGGSIEKIFISKAAHDVITEFTKSSDMMMFNGVEYKVDPKFKGLEYFIPTLDDPTRGRVIYNSEIPRNFPHGDLSKAKVLTLLGKLAHVPQSRPRILVWFGCHGAIGYEAYLKRGIDVIYYFNDDNFPYLAHMFGEMYNVMQTYRFEDSWVSPIDTDGSSLSETIYRLQRGTLK